jgi:ATP-binding cassette subfamily B protein
MTKLANQCFSYLHRHSFSFFNNNFVGSLTKKVKWFNGAFENIMDNVIWNVLPMIVNFIFVIAVFFSINLFFGLAIIAWMAIVIAANLIFNHFKLKYQILSSELETKTTGLLADTITNNSNVKLFNGYSKEVDDFAVANKEFMRVKKLCWDLGMAFSGVQALLMVMLEVGVMFYAIHLWQINLLTVGTFVLIQTYIGSMISNLWNIGKIIMKFYESLANAEEMTEILLQDHEIKDISNAESLVVEAGGIEFKKVSFNYNETRSILKNFNLEVKPRERLAIIGPSGSGKTTIIKLIFRIHDLLSGKILIDGQDVSKVTQESLWQNVSLVPQDPMLFHRTLRENIRYGRPEATDDEIIMAAKAAHCHEFISQFPEGYDTFVGERGVKLSGGERQRVAIARAILKNAPILVMDEATSSLDSESELLIQDALDRLMKGKTVIVIAHRLSTIRKMDRIIVVDEGKVVEDGNHETLFKKDGIYNKLWEIQAGGFDS